MMGMSGKAAALIVLMLSVLVVLAVHATMAQTTGSPAQVPAPQAAPPAPGLSGDVKQVEGTIQKVTGDKVTLADGTELTIPSGLTSVKRSDLKPGASVKASYEEKGSQKMVTSIQVEPSR
jgi:hypothetical protein